MSDAPYSCYYELVSASTTVGSEFFQCFNHFTRKYDDFLCVLTISSISIYHAAQRGDIDTDDLEFEERRLELRFHKRVFGHLHAVARFHRGNNKSDVLFIAMDSGKLVMSEYLIYGGTLNETIICNLELGNDNPSLDGKQFHLGHGSKPVLVVSEEYQVVAFSVYGEQIFSCSLIEDSSGNIAVDKKLVTHLQSDLLLTGPILDICFVGGYGNATCAVLQQDHLLTIGHAAKVLNTSSLSVLGFNYDSATSALIWRVASLPHDCLRLVSYAQNSLSGAVLIISQNAAIVVHQDSASAVPTNGFASVTVGTNTNINMKPWKGADKGLILSGSKWLQFGSASRNNGSFMGFLRDGTIVLLHLSYYSYRQSNTLDMELVKYRENFFSHSCCISREKPELLFVSSKSGQNALFRLGYNTYFRQAEQDHEKILYPQSFLGDSETASAIVDIDEEEKLYGSHGLDVEKVNSSQWIVDLRLLDIFSKSGPILHGMIMKPDDSLSQIDHVRWNRIANVPLASYSSAASYIPERESKEALVLACGLDKDTHLNRFFSGIAYSKSATKSFPGGKTMYNFTVFGRSVILLAFANKTRVFRCELVSSQNQNLSKAESTVKFHEWTGEESGFLMNSKSLFVGVLYESEDFSIVVQVTSSSIRLVKILSSLESEPLQDMSLHESIEIGGLGGLREEVFITADASSRESYIVLISSHLNTYFVRYHAAEENMELITVHRDPHTIGNYGDEAIGDLASVIDSAIISVSLFVGQLKFLDFNWPESIRAASAKKSVTDLELEEIALYGSPLESADDVTSEKISSIDPLSKSSEEKLQNFWQATVVEPVESDNEQSFAIVTDKNGVLYFIRLNDLTCVARSELVSLQADHIPLQQWPMDIDEMVLDPVNSGKSSNGMPMRSTSNGSVPASAPAHAHAGQNDESFIVETKLFAYSTPEDEEVSAACLHLAAIFSSGEFVLYRLESICGFHVALNRILTQTIHTRRYPGVPFIRGISNSEANEVPSIFMTSPDVEYICRMPPNINVMQHGRLGTRVYITAHDTKQLCFDRNFPVLLPLDFPETPLVNFGCCTALPLFVNDTSILGTLWYEYEDLDTTTEIAKMHRIKNKPLKQSTFGIYRQLPRQIVGAGMNGAMQAVSIEKTVHKCMEIMRLTDNKTEQALLEKRTYMLLCSHDVFRPFNPQVITEEDGDTENVEYERYFPNVESFQQPNPDLAPLPLTRTKEYRICLLQNGKIIDNFLIAQNEKVLDATVLYLSVEKMGQASINAPIGTMPPRLFEKRVFVLVSTLYIDKRGEDTQGNGRMLLLSLDYAIFEDDSIAKTTSEDASESKVHEDGNENGNSMDVDYPLASNGHDNAAVHKVADAAATANTANGTVSSKQSLAQQQFLGSIQAKLRQVWVGPGPSSVVHQMSSFSSSPDAPPGQWSNYVLATVGPILYVYKFNSETMELSQVSFYFASVSEFFICFLPF